MRHPSAPREVFPSAHHHPACSRYLLSFSLGRTILFPLTPMSHTHSTAASSSNFQLIIDNALKAYQKRTKNDLLLHPLAAQLQTCQSPTEILAVLQQQVQGPGQSRSGDDRWTKWLDPTINVLLTFSQTAGTVGLVCPKTCV